MSFPLRIVEDYDVDRLEVQAWQHVQLTSTNHPIGLIPVFEFVLFTKTVSGREVTGWKERNLRVDVRERAKPAQAGDRG